MPHVGGGAGKPLLPTLDKRFGAQGQSGISGVVSFGYFSLDKQRKVSRLSVREPTYKTAVAPATQLAGTKKLLLPPLLFHRVKPLRIGAFV